MIAQTDFLVRRNKLDEFKFVDGVPTGLPRGSVLMEVDRFSFGANNITYAMLGENAGYWNLFPGADNWGRIPVWGFGEVVRSAHDALAKGERVFGTFPMSSHLIIQPDGIAGNIFRDATAHRQNMPAAYNEYLRVTDDPAFAGVQGDLESLLRWQFMPAFLLNDFFANADFFGARTFVISSASSKTAIGLAYFLKGSASPKFEVIGLTSPANRGFVEETGYYDQVLAYDEIIALPPRPSVFVDISGNSKIRAAVHRQLGGHLKYNCRVGLTHQDAARDHDLPGPKPVWFNTAVELRKRLDSWGRGGLETRYAAPWREFAAGASRWLEIVRGRGHTEIEAIYREVLAGGTPPNRGYVLSLQD